MTLTTKHIRILTAIGSISTIPLAMLLAHIYKLEVCTMCYSQRGAFIAIGIGLLVWGKVGKTIFGLSSLLGLWLSARHTYIMYNPNKAVNSCGADLSFLWDMGQYSEVAKSLMLGGIDCTKEKFTILGLYFPTWSLISYVVIGIIGAFLIWESYFNARVTGKG